MTLLVHHDTKLPAPTMLSVLVMLNMKGPNTSTTHFDPLARQTEPEMLYTSHSLCFIVLVGVDADTAIHLLLTGLGRRHNAHLPPSFPSPNRARDDTHNGSNIQPRNHARPCQLTRCRICEVVGRAAGHMEDDGEARTLKGSAGGCIALQHDRLTRALCLLG